MFDDRIGNLQKMLARMGPEGRQRYATDHADDPIAVSMALFVNNIAKELKEGKRGEPEMQAPVVQQAIQAMNQPRMPQGMPPQGMPPQGQPQAPQQAPQGPQAPQGETQMAANGGYMDSRLPEEMGIGALPERSLSNMADGGIVGFAKGGDSGPGTTADYRRYALTQAAKMGLDPQFVDSIFSHESRTKDYPTGYDPNAESGTGSVGIGQLLAGTGKPYGVEPNERKNPIKNIDASLRFMKDLQSKYNNDPRLMAVAYNQGETVLNNHLAKNKGVLVPENLQKEIVESLTEKNKKIKNEEKRLTPTQIAQRAVEPVNYLKRTVDKPKDTTSPFGGTVAPAATAPAAANADAARDALVAQIPGDNNRYVAPQKTSKDTSGKSFSQFTGNEQVVGAGEAALGLGTGLVDYLGSAAKGLFTGITGGDTQKAANESMGSTTYDPRTEAGRVALENSQKFLTDTLKLPPYMARIGAGKPYPAARFVKPKESVAPTSVPAAAPTSAVRTVPTPAQVAAGNPSVTTAKPPVAQPSVAQPRLEGLQRINEAKKNNAAIRLAAEQEAAAKAGAPPPPNLVINPRVVPAKPKTVEVAGLPAIIEQTAAKEAAVKEAAAKEAAATAAKETVVKEAEVQAAPNVIPEGTGIPIEFPKTSPRITYPNVVTSLAKNAGAAATATDEANNTETAIDKNSVLRGKSGIADIDIGPAQERPSFDRTSGDDTTQFPSITPEIAKTAVTLAQAEIPKKEQSGFGYEDLMMFGLNLMAGQSPNALTNVGTAGIAALTSRQARAKAEADKLKSEAESDYYKARGEDYRDEIAQGPEKRRLAAKTAELLAEDRRTGLENVRLDREERLARQKSVDLMKSQKDANDVLEGSKEYNTALMEAQIARLTFDKISDPTQEQKDKFLRSQEIPRMMKREVYKSFGINPPKSNINSAGWNIAPAP